MSLILDGTTGVPVTTVTGTLPEANGGTGTTVGYCGFKNKIIGGDFTTNPWQRGTSFSALGNVYFADRWFKFTTSSAVITASRAADAPTATEAGIFTQHCMSLAVTTADAVVAAGDYFTVSQTTEGSNTASFGFGQTGSRNITLSFWVKGTKTGIHCVSIRNDGYNRSYVAEYTIVASNTWEKKTITIPVDTAGTWLYDNGVGLRLHFTLMCGTDNQTTANTWAAGNFIATSNQVNALDSTSNTFKLALVQLEAGSVATSFDVRSVGTELALCQRYYCNNLTGVGTASSTTVVALNLNFPVTMRATPTILVTSALTISDSGANYAQSSANSGTYAGNLQGGLLHSLLNFTGMTAYRVAYPNNGSTSPITASAEL